MNTTKPGLSYQVNIRMDSVLAELLYTYCKGRGLSLSEGARSLLREGLERKETLSAYLASRHRNDEHPEEAQV